MDGRGGVVASALTPRYESWIGGATRLDDRGKRGYVFHILLPRVRDGSSLSEAVRPTSANISKQFAPMRPTQR